MTIEDILAHVEIKQVLATYCRGVDRHDRSLIKSVYHPDALDHHTIFDGLGTDFADFIVDRYEASGEFGQHNLTTIYIELHGDVANVESYFIVFHNRPVNGQKALLSTGGRYLDRFEKRDGAWRIADRLVMLEWSRRNLPGEPWERAAAFISVGGENEDPSYELFARH